MAACGSGDAAVGPSLVDGRLGRERTDRTDRQDDLVGFSSCWAAAQADGSTPA